MSAVPQSNTNEAPVSGRDELVAFLEEGCKPESAWRIGTEHEKFPFRKSDYSALPYDGADGIRAILEGMTRFGWQPVYEGENIIALKSNGYANISLEPGGQFELSGGPLETVHETCREVHVHLDQVEQVCNKLDVGMIGLGFDPAHSRADIHWMPKGRYDIMRPYMESKGSLGIDMMIRTCTVQVNLDFASEADMVRKMRIALALQPVATALFANSPFTEGKPNGFKSYRSHVWTDTDPDRTGNLPFVFEDGFSFERYADYALDVPMYFVYRDGKYIDASGQSFRDFLDGKLPGLEGERPTLSDWSDHLTTLFPEVRMKKFIEMRGADAGRWDKLCALPALWVGLLYDTTARDAAWDLVKDWTQADRDALRADAPKYGLEAELNGRSLRDISRDMLAIAREGMKNRNKQGRLDPDETVYLIPLEQVLETGKTPADVLLDYYNGPANGDIRAIYDEFAY